MAAVVRGDVKWRAVTELAAVYTDDRAAVFYEGVNQAEGVRLRTAEYLRIEKNAISDAVVVFSRMPLGT